MYACIMVNGTPFVYKLSAMWVLCISQTSICINREYIPQNSSSKSLGLSLLADREKRPLCNISIIIISITGTLIETNFKSSGLRESQ